MAALWVCGFPALRQYNVTWDEALGDLFFGERYFSYFTSFDAKYLDFQTDAYPPERQPSLFASPFKIRPWEYYPVANLLAGGTSELLARQLHLLDVYDGFHALNLLLGGAADPAAVSPRWQNATARWRRWPPCCCCSPRRGSSAT